MGGQVVQLAISLAGIALVVGLCAALFGAESAALSAQAVAQSLAQDVPGFSAGRIALSRDRRAALIEDAQGGAVYLAVARGDGIVTRRLARGVGVTREGERLALALNEFTLSQATFELADAAEWQARLAA